MIRGKSVTDAARSLGVSWHSINRAARKEQVGIYNPAGRLICLLDQHITALRKHLHDGPGNPNFVAKELRHS
jgi:hypothetical protein